MSGSVTLTIAEAQALAASALVASNTARDNAASTARALVLAEVDGQSGHGLSRVASYALQAKVGKVNGNARPKLERTSVAAMRVDACHGFSYPALDVAAEALVGATHAAGVAAAALYHSHHFGQAGQHVERLAEAGLVALAFSNAPKAMACHGDRRAMLGTNPIAFAAPIPGRAPLVIDMSLSVAARGKIVAAQKEGRSIPADWAIDGAGKPTTDPAAALQGSLLPVGGPKGAALALLVEVLCAALAGSAFGWEASSLFDDKGGPPNLGQVLVGFDPSAFAGATFLARMEQLAADITGEGARLPGDRRLAARERARLHGLTIPASLHAEILALTTATS